LRRLHVAAYDGQIYINYANAVLDGPTVKKGLLGGQIYRGFTAEMRLANSSGHSVAADGELRLKISIPGRGTVTKRVTVSSSDFVTARTFGGTEVMCYFFRCLDPVLHSGGYGTLELWFRPTRGKELYFTTTSSL
jgi:hypothetical protein